MRPAGPDVSIDSVNDRNFASAELFRSRMVRRSFSEWAVFFHRLGEIRDRTFENSDTRLQASTSLVAAITLWNTVYLGRAVDQLRSQGEVIDDTLLGHIASLGWEHISFNGDYVWPTEPLQQSFRPLRNPRSAFLDPA